MPNSARFRRGWRLRESRTAARPARFPPVRRGSRLCRPSRAVAELLADGPRLDDAERDLGGVRGRQ
jgi:hypothetical protein